MENKGPENSGEDGDFHRNDAAPPDHPASDRGPPSEVSIVTERDGDGEGDGDTAGAIETQNIVNAIEETGEVEASPKIHYTLENLFEELDQFLSTLSVHKTNDNEGRSDDNTVVDDDGYIQIPHFVGKFLDLVEEKLARYNSGESRMKEEEDSSLFEAVSRVSKLLDSLKAIKSCLDHHGPLINLAGSIQQRAMAFLEEEFRILLEESAVFNETVSNVENNKKIKNTAEQDQSGAGVIEDQENQDTGDDTSGVEYPGYPEGVVSMLKKIAGEMIGGGYGRECREVYLVARRNILMQTLKNQEFEKVSVDEVQKMNWETLEKEILIWNKTFKGCSTVYFPGELKLAGQIFPEEHGGRELFSIVAHGLAIQFLGFAEAVAMTKRSTEKLFKVLDIYETIRDNFPAMERLFPEEFCNELRKEVNIARSRLGETAIFIFSDLENSIKSDSGKTPVPGGAVHPLTRYTMNYLRYSCEYKDTLEQVFKEHSKIERVDSARHSRSEETDATNANSNHNARNGRHENADESSSPFSSQLMRVMEFLDSNLEAKSKLYKDVSLSCIFMMNNGRYIVQKIKGSPEIHQVMGDTWCRRRSSALRNYHKNYQRETWGKLLGFLGHEGLMNNGKIVKPNLKERFKSFNATFDEIHKTQSTWVVNDEQLQSELRVSISAVIIPAYRSFLGRFAQYLDPGRQTEKYIKYQGEDIENLIDDLFEGKASSSTITARRRT